MPDWPVRHRPAPETAFRDIRSADPKARLDAIEALAEAPPESLERAREALVAALEDPSPDVRAAAALALAEIGAAPAVERLIALAGAEDSRVAQAAVIALGESGDRRAFDPLLAALRSERADIRFQAVIAVARLAPAEAFEHLERAADDPDPEVRANALAALADTAGERAAPVMRSRLDDDEPEVRIEAALALAELGDRAATPVLLEALDDADAAPQAVRALGLLRDPAAVTVLTALCGRMLVAAPIRAAAAAALCALDDPTGARELDRWLGSRRREPRALAIALCGELRLAAAVDRLVAILSDPRHPDRDAAARALGAIGDLGARPALERAAGDPDPDLAADARAALELLQGATPS
jgi:HEAT repeat protein